MGRDNARAVGGLEGGRAPAQAWAAFMRVAVANRPVEQFATEVTFPERLEEEELLLGEDGEPLILDENGNPIEGVPSVDDPGLPDGIRSEQLDEEFIDKAIGRRPVDAQPEPDEPTGL